MKVSLIYTTLPDENAVVKLQKLLVESKLVACVNAMPISSCYEWNDNLEMEGEYIALCKTMPSHVDAVIEFMEQNHPYEIPCILTWKVKANKSYGRWVKSVIKPVED